MSVKATTKRIRKRRVKKSAPVIATETRITSDTRKIFSKLLPEEKDNINYLSSIKFIRGSLLETPGNVYDLVDLIKNIGMENVISHIDSHGEFEDFADFMFSSPMFDEERNREEIQIDLMNNPAVTTEGIFECTKCGGNKTVSREKQRRSADEPYTTFIICVSCGNKWTVT